MTIRLLVLGFIFKLAVIMRVVVVVYLKWTCLGKAGMESKRRRKSVVSLLLPNPPTSNILKHEKYYKCCRHYQILLLLTF